MFKRVMGVIALFGMISSAAAQAGGREGLLAADRAFSALAVARGSNAAYLALITRTARLFGDGREPPIFGRIAAERRFAQEGLARPKHSQLSWVPDHATVSADGTLGVTDGRWRFVARLKGKRIIFHGHYLRVWRRVAGHWKVLADMGTTDHLPKH